jgi:hypothetical protein
MIKNNRSAWSTGNNRDLREHLNDRHGVGSGPRCFGVSVLVQRFLENFKAPRDIAKYDGKLNPTTWLEDYEMAMSIQNAREMIMTHYMPLMMKDVARTWIRGLPANIIHSWRDMRRVFVKNFEGTYRRPATDKDIENCVQRPGETTRKYLTC